MSNPEPRLTVLVGGTCVVVTGVKRVGGILLFQKQRFGENASRLIWTIFLDKKDLAMTRKKSLALAARSTANGERARKDASLNTAPCRVMPHGQLAPTWASLAAAA